MGADHTPAPLTWTGVWANIGGPLQPGETVSWNMTGDWAAEDVFVVVSADYVGVGYSGEFEVTLSRWRDDSQTPYVVEPWIYITCKQSTDPQPYYWFWVAWSSPAGS
jgi:hypothetical protein